MKKIKKFGEVLLDFVTDYIVSIVLVCALLGLFFLLFNEYNSYTNEIQEIALQMDNQEISMEAGFFIKDVVTFKYVFTLFIAVGAIIIIGAYLILDQIRRSSERLQLIDLRLWEIERIIRLNYMEQKNKDLHIKNYYLRRKKKELEEILQELEEDEALYRNFESQEPESDEVWDEDHDDMDDRKK